MSIDKNKKEIDNKTINKTIFYLIPIGEILVNMSRSFPRKIISITKTTFKEEYLRDNEDDYILILDNNIYEYPFIVKNKKAIELRKKYRIIDRDYLICGEYDEIMKYT